MSLRDLLLVEVKRNPEGVRQLLSDPEVRSALGDIGIGGAAGIQVLELHAPSESARKADGLGTTLCGRNGIRHTIVTCGHCRKAIAKR